MRRNQFSSAALSFAVGIGIGAALGLLLAPQSGEETRDDLLGGARDIVADAVRAGRQTTKQVRKTVGEVADQLKEAANIGERVYSKAKEA